MKTFSSFCCVLTMLLSFLPVFSQQPNPKVLRNWELVDLPFSPPDENALLGGIKVASGVGIQPPIVKPEFDELNSTDIVFQSNGSNSISASATIFSFLTGNFKKADYKFQLTSMPNLKIYRVKNVPLVLKNSGLEAGKVIMAYAVADSFTLCSDKISELIIQGSTTGGTPANPRSATITRKCETLSKESLESVKTGNIAVPQKPAVDNVQIDPAKKEILEKTITQKVVEQFEKLGLQNISATVDFQNQRVTVVKSDTPVVVAWQLVEYDSRNNSNRAVKNKFRASDEVILSEGGRQVYKVRVGLWDSETVKKQNLSPEKPLCVYFKVTDIATNTEFIPVTYCPSTSPSEFMSSVDLIGYVRPSADEWRTKSSIPLINKATESESFLSNDSLIRPKLTFSRPIFNINSNGVTATMDIQIDEIRAKFKLVRK